MRYIAIYNKCQFVMKRYKRSNVSEVLGSLVLCRSKTLT